MKKFLVVAAALFLLCGASTSFAVTMKKFSRAFSLNLSTPWRKSGGHGGAFISTCR